MQDKEHHGLRNFLLLISSFGIAWYLWKERDRLKEKLQALDNEPEQEETIIDIDEAEQVIEIDEPELDEESLEPALISPTPIEETSTADNAPLLPTSFDLPEEFTESEEELEDFPAVPEEKTAGEVSIDEISQANKSDEPIEAEPSKPPTWVRPVNGECPKGFPIKARFATGHFHEPGDRGYDKIIPDCCYPSTEDAEADGFTPSRWS